MAVVLHEKAASGAREANQFLLDERPRVWLGHNLPLPTAMLLNPEQQLPRVPVIGEERRETREASCQGVQQQARQENATIGPISKRTCGRHALCLLAPPQQNRCSGTYHTRPETESSPQRESMLLMKRKILTRTLSQATCLSQCFHKATTHPSSSI
ncbi:hypothetical protein EPA93_15010 [Ktedonosporobacter rubrisoli]|uniref:Uncharacterized protein n=1 Tax=Ktedonosporobacter rubrisoli TaxID=2509675 RepID=A0A4P6JPP8_KTERU|nr:hypothetical protein [Ktedonosporobacter rubrisoli]QBD77234.1 hypothetical protein EPA93_15010 [Ktedonosporobacter rubrisoli]